MFNMTDNSDGSRLRQRLNPLLTSLAAFSQSSNTPGSAVSYNSTSYITSTPASAIQPYNPQQWLPSPMAGPGPERGHHLSSPDSNASPLPPPPYSPPRSQRPTSMYLDGTHIADMPSARTPVSFSHRPSPEPQNSQAFPPPPNGRGASRERRFGFPSLNRRREPEQTASPGGAFGSLHCQAVGSTSTRPTPLSIQIPQFGPRRMEHNPSSPLGIPPSARRAASTGSLDTPISAPSRSASQSRWDPAMPLPPPPPGPPPLQQRSQSTSRNFGSVPEPIVSPPTRRPPHSGVTALGPVPPTPANWIDEDHTRTEARVEEPLRRDSPIVSHPLERTASSQKSTTPMQSPNALRSDKPLKERRNESRTRSSRLSTNASVSKLENIVIPSLSGGLARKSPFGRKTPRSAGQTQASRSEDTGNSDKDDENRGSTPRALVSAGIGPRLEISTPPFSPWPAKPTPPGESSSLVPKALPTPPPRSSSTSRSRTPMPDIVVPTPLTSRSAIMARELATRQTPGQFSHDTIDRFAAFAQRESTAADDAARVRLFTEFIVSESRIRRERYAAAISAMGSEILDLTRDLFRPMTSRRESTASQGSEWTPQSSEPNRSHSGSVGSMYRFDASKLGESTSASPSASAVPTSPGGPTSGSANYNSNFQPSLSPILSMSVSDRRDEDSRGRPASRWWESTSSTGESTKWERSKRESKYMSVPKEAREALQWMESPVGGSSRRAPSNEWPTEKQGWHESPAEQSCHQTYSSQGTQSTFQQSISMPNTPNPSCLDVSRLVTLPPPYPRHHPAVNNNHPQLAGIRNSIRTLSDLSEVELTKSRSNHDSRVMHDEAVEAATQRRKSLRENLQQEVGLGRMTYAEAAAIEADSSEAEKQTSKDLEKKDFDHFQTEVVVPMNALLTGRITKVTQLFDGLRSRLIVENREPNPNMPQEEGDEQPELLEKLTLLKWIFETREILHRAVYDLLSDRNDRYREMVITPYRLVGNEEKMAHASNFFAEDAGRRSLAFANEILQRADEFRDVVEENVMRGVEMQLSAFWDIAPPLCRLLDRVPSGASPGSHDEAESSVAGGWGHGRSLVDFRIQIPQAEIVENPSYVDHPLQYLYSLLLHAEKSTYQFIENQTNLFCLLHEANEAVLLARARLMEEDGGSAKDNVDRFKRDEVQRLTDDLKEKVRVVQEQWRDALGEKVGHVKERVREWLLETGAWDESLEDHGVGSL